MRRDPVLGFNAVFDRCHCLILQFLSPLLDRARQGYLSAEVFWENVCRMNHSLGWRSEFPPFTSEAL